MNLVSNSTNTLEKRQKLGEVAPTFTFTFASPSSSPLKRAISEPAQTNNQGTGGEGYELFQGSMLDSN